MFGDRVEDQKKFVDRLKHVVLYRIEVPEHTDLNRYFEIMNTRGEQLEQHDILKARLMNYLDDAVSVRPSLVFGRLVAI